MAKIMVIYQQPTDVEGFEKHYQEVHMPLAQQVKGVVNASVNKVQQALGTEMNLYQIVEIEFNSMEDLQTAMQSDEWKKVEEDGQNLAQFLNEGPILTITN
ncbi:hypothetical protein N781_14475 [Pontibacillus halophilus JSM 076056 = DSM 19796]|uniref:EthD domain-containing protein n=1 Tax=Pontibacillus halophilus JSM 076056 = DSM 19796 TaxID=1385510 RepID=A0A0A5I9P9_9BACI|nr:EthD family reductase [Pontibacillus halophilus]KGX92542.1 hypothetical protein N781_14475 [Pontibacillus halophilus JSM 076056 = DSM 19796]